MPNHIPVVSAGRHGDSGIRLVSSSTSAQAALKLGGGGVILDSTLGQVMAHVLKLEAVTLGVVWDSAGVMPPASYLQTAPVQCFKVAAWLPRVGDH